MRERIEYGICLGNGVLLSTYYPSRKYAAAALAALQTREAESYFVDTETAYGQRIVDKARVVEITISWPETEAGGK